MSKCCKCAKWFPHNWLCLKGLSIIFLTLFYLAIVLCVYQMVAVIMHPGITGSLMWRALLQIAISNLGVALGFLTMAKILRVLRKIKQAVAPCCCSKEEAKPEEAKQEETK